MRHNHHHAAIDASNVSCVHGHHTALLLHSFSTTHMHEFLTSNPKGNTCSKGSHACPRCKGCNALHRGCTCCPTAGAKTVPKCAEALQGMQECHAKQSALLSPRYVHAHAHSVHVQACGKSSPSQLLSVMSCKLQQNALTRGRGR